MTDSSSSSGGSSPSESSTMDSIISRFNELYDEDDDLSLDMCDQIYEADQQFIDAPKQHGHYYLGNWSVLDLLDVAVSPCTFFQFEYKDIVEYVCEYSVHSTRRRPPKIDILQLYIVRDTYHIITKTHWIRLIQRHWRKVYQERQYVFNGRKQLRELRHRELTGKFTVNLRWLPGIYGMMSIYA
jgi:hypothetical protein